MHDRAADLGENGWLVLVRGTGWWEQAAGNMGRAGCVFFGGDANRSVIKALVKLRINLWPDLCYMTSEPKLLRIHAYFLYKNCPFRLDRLITGKLFGVQENLMVFLLRCHLCLFLKNTPGIWSSMVCCCSVKSGAVAWRSE